MLALFLLKAPAFLTSDFLILFDGTHWLIGLTNKVSTVNINSLLLRHQNTLSYLGNFLLGSLAFGSKGMAFMITVCHQFSISVRFEEKLFYHSDQDASKDLLFSIDSLARFLLSGLHLTSSSAFLIIKLERRR